MATSVIKGNPVNTGTITYIGPGNPTFEQISCQECNGIVTFCCRCYEETGHTIGTYAYATWFRIPEGFRPRVRTAVTAYIIFDGAVVTSQHALAQTTVTIGYVNPDGGVDVLYTKALPWPKQIAAWGTYHI